MTKKWVTKEGDLIPYKNLEDSHLLNILAWIRKNAKNGVEILIGTPADIDDMTFATETIFDEDVFELYDYKGLLKEAKKRKLNG